MPIRKKLEVVRALFIFWLIICVHTLVTNFMIDRIIDAIIFVLKRLFKK